MNASDFIEWKNDSMKALSVTLPGRFMLWVNPSSAMRCLKAPAAYSMPRSVWKISPGGGLRLCTARFSAASVRLTSLRRPKLQPTILAAALVHHHGQVAIERTYLQVGDVTDPDLVRVADRQVELTVGDERVVVRRFGQV